MQVSADTSTHQFSIIDQESAIAIKQQALFDSALHPIDRSVWLDYAEEVFRTATQAVTANTQRVTQGIINWL